MNKIVVGLLALLVLAGCGSAPQNDRYDVVALCGTVAAPVTRVPDNMCPIGDGDVPGHPFKWYYQEMPAQRWYADDDDIDVVYVGSPIDTVHYVRERPARVSTLRINRGLPANCGCPAGSTSATSAKTSRSGFVTVDRAEKPQTVTRQSSDSVERGGFGTTKRATNAPKPNRSLDSAAPGRTTSRPLGSASGPKSRSK